MTNLTGVISRNYRRRPIASCRRALRRFRAAQRDFAKFDGLSEYLLRDMGMTREDVYHLRRLQLRAYLEEWGRIPGPWQNLRCARVFSAFDQFAFATSA